MESKEVSLKASGREAETSSPWLSTCSRTCNKHGWLPRDSWHTVRRGETSGFIRWYKVQNSRMELEFFIRWSRNHDQNYQYELRRTLTSKLSPELLWLKKISIEPILRSPSPYGPEKTLEPWGRLLSVDRNSWSSGRWADLAIRWENTQSRKRICLKDKVYPLPVNSVYRPKTLSFHILE